MNTTIERTAEAGLAAATGSADSMLSTAYIRIYSRCPACHNDTLMINKGRLLCTWHKCSDPTLIDRLGDHAERPPDDYKKRKEQRSLAAPAGSAAASADKWAEEGRQSLRKANDAISEGKFGTADAYRQSAALAFANEIELRKQPNAELCSSGDEKR